MKKTLSILLVGFLSAQSVFSVATVIDRGVQFTEVDFVNSTLTLTNLNGADSVDLSGWRFCSHDDNQMRRYSAAAGLNGISLAPNETLVVEFGAVSGGPGTIGIGAIGGNFAGPLDNGPFAIEIYETAPFGTAANMVDHLQWSIDGIDNITADARSSFAQTAGLWTDQNLWIATTAETELLVLNSPAADSILHGPSSYTALVPEPSVGILAMLGSGLLLRRRRRF